MEPVAAMATIDGDVPRGLRRRRRRLGLWSLPLTLLIPHVWFGLLSLGFALCVVANALLAAPIEGHVTHKAIHADGLSYTLRISSDVGGRSRAWTDEVSAATWERAQIGDRFSLADDDAGDVSKDIFFVLFAIVASFMGAMVVRASVFAPLRSWSLLRSGRRATATIVSHHHRSGPRRTMDDVVISFATAAGELVERKVRVDDWGKSGLLVGGACTVFHDPTRPARCTIYELASWEIVERAPVASTA